MIETKPAATRDERCPCCGRRLPPSGGRRVTLIDGMILVIAAAVALAILRPYVDDPGWLRPIMAIVGVLVASTPTILILRLRSPRPSIRRLMRQPGFVAGVAGTAVLALMTVAIGILALIRLAIQAQRATPVVALRAPPPPWWDAVVFHFGEVVGPAVIAAWLVLALSGRRRPARGWLDPLGRAIGTAWIVLFVVDCCVRLSWLSR